MKIITILGSPRTKGNTAKVLSMFEDNVGAKHEIERINIAQYKVGGCLGCYKCKEIKDEPGCVQKDDALTIFEKMIRADAIVYAYTALLLELHLPDQTADRPTFLSGFRCRHTRP